MCMQARHLDSADKGQEGASHAAYNAQHGGGRCAGGQVRAVTLTQDAHCCLLASCPEEHYHNAWSAVKNWQIMDPAPITELLRLNVNPRSLCAALASQSGRAKLEAGSCP